MTWPAWRAAMRVVDELVARRGVRAVAVTGSLARGDFAPGSDVDLWVVGARDAREELVVDEVALSLLWQTPRRARTFETLWRFEVERAVILHDPRGLLAAVRERAAQRRAEVSERLVSGTAGSLLALVASAARTSPPRGVATLREVARRGAALAAFVERGWRVPRMRHLRAALPAQALARLLDVLALPKSAERAAALLPAARRGRPPVVELPLPDDALVRRLIGAARDDDALIAIRQGLPPGARGEPCEMTAAQRKLFAHVHGFERVPPRRADVRALAEQVFYVLDHLRVLELAERYGALRETLRALALRMH